MLLWVMLVLLDFIACCSFVSSLAFGLSLRFVLFCFVCVVCAYCVTCVCGCLICLFVGLFTCLFGIVDVRLRTCGLLFIDLFYCGLFFCFVVLICLLACC